MIEKNPYPQETPQWQLWEIMTSAERAGHAFAEDAERMQKKSAEQRDKAARFRAALETLVAD